MVGSLTHNVPYFTAGEDFYGRTLRMLLAGFQRREKKFASFPELVATINKVSHSESTRIGTPEIRTQNQRATKCV